MVSRIDARYLISFGFLVTSLGLFHLSRITLDISFSEAVWARVYQAAGLAFLFIPINTVAYIGMQREKSNAISGMTNLSRNIGGSIGISAVTTIVARRAQYHQSVLAAHTDNYSHAFRNAVTGTSNSLMAHGATSVNATHQAYGLIANTIYRQANMEAYLDAYRVLAIGAAVLVPCVWIMKKARPSQAAVH